jgi:hypothetical protein
METTLLQLLVLLLAGAAARAERPPFMSAAQHSIVRNIEKDAAPASAAATPQLLAALDDAALRQTLSECCPEVASLTASELLARFEAEAAVAEITHNIQPRTPQDWRSHYCINCADAELDQLNNHPPNNMTDYLPNMYELALLNVSNHMDLAMTWVGCQTVFETSIFGFAPFSKPWPGNLYTFTQNRSPAFKTAPLIQGLNPSPDSLTTNRRCFNASSSWKELSNKCRTTGSRG